MSPDSECIRRAPEGSVCPVGTCRRRWQSDPKVGSETSGGRGQRPPRRLSDRGREPSEPPDGWCEERGPACGAAGCGEARFLRLSGARNACAQRGRGRAASMARAAGAGTRLPRRERARVAGALPGGRGRVVRRRAGVGAARRVSCAGRALETLFLLAALAGVWARNGKKGAVPEGAGSFMHAGGRKKFFLSKKSFLSMKRNFFRGAGRTKKARLPWGGGRRLSNNPFGEVWRTRRSSKVNSYRPALPGGRGVCALGRKHFLSFWRKRPPQADFFDKLSPPPLGRRAEQPGGKDRRGPAFSKPFRR